MLMDKFAHINILLSQLQGIIQDCAVFPDSMDRTLDRHTFLSRKQ